jgi:homoserine dehydrogenase
LTQRPRRPRPLLLRLALCGFGAVGRELVRLLERSRGRLASRERLLLRLTGIASRTLPPVSRPAGLRPRLLLRRRWKRPSPTAAAPPGSVEAVVAWIRRVPADVLIELTPLAPRSGEPALSYLEAALRRGLHAVTANKGPIAWGLRRLRRAAARAGALLYHEGTVLDGVPVFSLRGEALAGCRVLGLRGIVNSTTQYLLQEVERGRSREEALAEMRRRGIAEADPRHDLEGWDAALKVAVLAGALLDADLRPDQVRRRGIVGLSDASIRRAAAAGRPWRLLAEAGRRGGRVWGRVGPRRLRAGDPLAHLPGTSNALTLFTDPLGPLTLVEWEPGVRQTAAAVLMDLVRLGRALRPLRGGAARG